MSPQYTQQLDSKVGQGLSTQLQSLTASAAAHALVVTSRRDGEQPGEKGDQGASTELWHTLNQQQHNLLLMLILSVRDGEQLDNEGHQGLGGQPQAHGRHAQGQAVRRQVVFCRPDGHLHVLALVHADRMLQQRVQPRKAEPEQHTWAASEPHLTLSCAYIQMTD